MGDAEMIAALRVVLPRCEPVRYSGTCWGADLLGQRWVAATPDGVVTIEDLRVGHAEYEGDAAGARAYLQATALATLALLQAEPRYVANDGEGHHYDTPEAALAAAESLAGSTMWHPEPGDRTWWGVVVGTAIAEDLEHLPGCDRTPVVGTLDRCAAGCQVPPDEDYTIRYRWRS